MKSVGQYVSMVGWVASCVCLALLGAGCSGGTDVGDFLPITTLFRSSATRTLAPTDLAQSAKDVEISQIESLTLTITEVSLDRGAEEQGEEEEAGTKIVVFSGAMDVNILDLLDVSRVLSSVEIPAGTYTKIRLSIENPRLVLNSDPDAVITNIQLTANGRLFVSKTFELPEGEPYLLILTFEDIHLVETGNGGYVLTPQLRADIDIEPAEAVVVGTITAMNKDTDTLIVQLDDATEIEVLYTDALIYLPGDTDTPTGTEDDLFVGLEAEIAGLLTVDGSLTAETIRILPVAT